MNDFLDAFLWEPDTRLGEDQVSRLEAILKAAQQFVHPYDEPEEDPFIDLLSEEEEGFDSPLPEYFHPVNDQTVSDIDNDPELQEAVQDTFSSIMQSHHESKGNQWYEWSEFLHKPEQWNEDQFQIIQALSIFTGGPRSGISQIRFPGNARSLKEYKRRLGETFEGVAKQPFQFTESTVSASTKILTAMASNPQGPVWPFSEVLEFL